VLALSLNLVTPLYPSIFAALETPEITNTRDFMIAEGLSQFNILLCVLIYLGRPSTSVSLLEITSSLLVAASRSILAFAPDPYSDYGYLYVVDGVLFSLLISTVLHRRRVRLVSTFSPSRVATFVLSTLPAALVSALVGCVFLFGETLSCLLENKGVDGATGFAATDVCIDSLRSNANFAQLAVLFACARLLIVPFLTKNYTMADALRFDFEFGYQVQLISLAVAALISLFAYGSKQEGGYPESTWYIITESGRLLYQYAFYMSSVFFIAAVALTQNFLGSGSALSSRLPRLSAYGQQLRGHLRTRHSGRVAPVFRGALSVFTLLFLLPTILALYYSYTSTGDKLWGRQLYNLYGFSIVWNIGAASIYFMTTPKGMQTSENLLFITTVPLNIGMSLTSAVLLKRTAEDIVIHIMFLVGSYMMYKSLHASRRYLAMHSEAQLDKHFRRSLAFILTLLGPIMYLFSEAFGCSIGTSEVANLHRCTRLSQSNWTTEFNFVMFCVSYAAFEIEHLHVTTEDTIALRNIEAGSLVRRGLQATAFVISLAAFGARPRNLVTDLDELTDDKKKAEIAVVSMINVLMYSVVLIWLVVLAWQTVHVNRLIMNEKVSIGEIESAEHVGRSQWAGKKRRNLIDRLNAWVEKKAVGAGEARMSPLFSFVAGFFSYVLVILPIFAAAAILLLSNKGDTDARNYASLMTKWSGNFKVFGATCVAIYMFMDMEVVAATNGSGSSSNNIIVNNSIKWQYRDVHACIIVLATVFEACISYYLHGQVSELIIFGLVGYSVLGSVAIYQRRKALATATLEQRLYHVTKVVFPATISIIPTLIFMTSEMGACDLLEFFKAHLEEKAYDMENNECDGISFGITPLLLILCALFFGKVAFVNVRSAFTMKNMSTLNLTFVESIQLVLFGICGFYATTAYALRSERVVRRDSLELELFSCFTVLLIIATALNFFKQGKQRHDQATEPQESRGGGESLSGGSVSNGRSSLEERIFVGKRRSLWEGGTKGARGGTGALKSASKRGIAVERASAEEAMGGAQLDEDEDEDEDEDDAIATISPGYV
jgi:hypothetical protein